MSKFGFLFVSVDSPPKVGGVSLLAEQLSICLSKQYGREAVYVGPKGTYFTEQHNTLKLYEDFQSDTSLRAGPYSALEDERIEELFDKIIKSYDLDCIIIWHPFYYGLGGIAAAQKNEIPVIVYVHGTELTSQIKVGRGDDYTFEPDPSSSELDQRLYQTIVSANSSYTASVIEEAVPDSFVSVVGCGIADDLFERQTRVTREYNLYDKIVARESMRLMERKTLIQIGRLVPHKNHKTSIDLIAASKDLQLVIVGDGPMMEQLKEHADKEGVSDRVYFKGLVSEEDKWKLLRASDAGLLISNFDEATGGYEGFGIAMLEYAAAGCGVASTGKYGMYDFVKRYDAGIIILDDERPIEEHASELESKLNDFEFMKDHIAHARDIIDKRFTWSKVADRIITSLEE